MEKTTVTIKAPETILGIAGYTRLDLFYRHLSPFWNWDDEDTPAKLDELIKAHNPNELDFAIPRVYGYERAIKNSLKKYYRNDMSMITDIRLPKINIITITKENVLKTRNHYKNFDTFCDKLGLGPNNNFEYIVTHYMAKKTDEPLRFEVILKGTEIELDTWDPLIPCYC